MKVYKKTMCMILTVVLMAFAPLTGCTEKTEEAPTEITLMHGWGGTFKNHKIMQEIYDGFSKENPDIVLKCISYSDSSIAVEKANDMLAVGKGPDILSTNGLSYYVRNAVKCDRLLDLMPFIEADQSLKKQIHPAVFETWETSGGKLYTIPDALEVAGFWYNEAYLKEAGIADKEGNMCLASSWEEFKDITEQLQKWIDSSGQELSVFAMDNAQMAELLFLARLAGENENGIRAAENPYIKIREETLTSAIKDLDFVMQHSRVVDNIENARQDFIDGKSIIYFNGVWESELLMDSSCQKDFRYSNYPAPGGKSLAYVSPSSGYVVTKQRDKKKEEACVRFLKYMLSEEVQTKIAVETGQAPSNPDIDMEKVIQEYPLLGNAVNTAYQAEIQIKTMDSVWPGYKVDIVHKYLDTKFWNTDGISEILRSLNGNQGEMP